MQFFDISEKNVELVLTKVEDVFGNDRESIRNFLFRDSHGRYLLRVVYSQNAKIFLEIFLQNTGIR